MPIEDKEWDVIFGAIDGLIMTNAYLCERLIAVGALQREELIWGLEDIATRAKARDQFRGSIPAKLAQALRQIGSELDRPDQMSSD